MEWTGYTDRRIQQLVDEGVVRREGRGKYLLAESLTGLFRHIEMQAKAGDKETLTEAEIRYKTAKAEETEFKLEVDKGNYFYKEDVRLAVSNMLSTFIAHMRALPTKMAIRLDGLPKTEIKKELEFGIRDCTDELRELAIAPERGRKVPRRNSKRSSKDSASAKS